MDFIFHRTNGARVCDKLTYKDLRLVVLEYVFSVLLREESPTLAVGIVRLRATPNGFDPVKSHGLAPWMVRLIRRPPPPKQPNDPRGKPVGFGFGGVASWVASEPKQSPRQAWGIFRTLNTYVLENDALRIVVTPEKGADIVALVDKKTGIDVMLRLPAGLRSWKSEVPLMPHPNRLFSFYEGGWQELFPVGSNFGKYYGAEHPTHGEVPLLNWDHAILEDTARRVAVEFRVRMVMSPFELRRKMVLDASTPELVLEESIQNRSTIDLKYMWGHHPAFGAPFLSGDCRIELPKCRLLAGTAKQLKILPETRSGRAMFYALDLARGVYGIHNDKLGFGFGMAWDHRVFSKIWIWQSLHFLERAPFFKREYACAVEPFTSLPHQIYGRRDPLPVLKAGQKLETTLKAFLYRGKLPAK